MAAPGCILPDRCIVLEQPGFLMCKTFANAVDLDTGLPIVTDGGQLPRACMCASSEERDVLLSGPGTPGYEVLIAQLDAAARVVCVEMAVNLGVANHNCMSEDQVEGPLTDEGRQDICPIADCEIVPTGDEECPSTCEIGSPDTTGGETGGAAGTGGAGGGTAGSQVPPPWAPDTGPRLTLPEARP